MSYKQVVVSNLSSNYAESFELSFLGPNEEAKMINNDEALLDERPTYVDIKKGMKAILFTDAQKKSVCKPWKYSLIVKLYGPSIGYKFLQEMLRFL